MICLGWFRHSRVLTDNRWAGPLLCNLLAHASRLANGWFRDGRSHRRFSTAGSEKIRTLSCIIAIAHANTCPYGTPNGLLQNGSIAGSAPRETPTTILRRSP